MPAVRAFVAVVCLALFSSLSLVAGAEVLPGVAAAAGAESYTGTGQAVKATEAEGQAEARRTGERVEVGVLRGERRTVYANPDGSYTQIEGVRPVRVRRGEKWLAADASLVKRPDGSIVPKAAAVGMRFSGGGDGPFARLERAGRLLARYVDSDEDLFGLFPSLRQLLPENASDGSSGNESREEFIQRVLRNVHEYLYGKARDENWTRPQLRESILLAIDNKWAQHISDVNNLMAIRGATRFAGIQG